MLPVKVMAGSTRRKLKELPFLENRLFGKVPVLLFDKELRLSANELAPVTENWYREYTAPH
jgi:hypothetical protein